MMCDHREHDMLLLAHRELPLLRGIALRVHLSRCLCCRERYQQLATVSVMLDSVLRTPGTPAWTSADARLSPQSLFASVSMRKVLLWSALIATSVLLLYGIFHTLSQRPHRGASQSKAIRDKGCAPDLPNDLCR